MIDIKSKSKIHLHWKVNPYDYSKEKCDMLAVKTSKKYKIPKDRIKVIPDFVINDAESDSMDFTSDVIQNIQDPSFQVKLFKDYLDMNNVEGYDFELIKQIDSEINGQIDYQIYDKYRRYSIKWVRWDNFLSYGADNYLDFSSLNGLVLLSGEPLNQSGKTTMSVDLLHFLLFGKTAKAATQDKIFNKHLKEATNVVVEGCINIDGCDYIIKRTLTRPQQSKRSDKSKTTQKVEYYRLTNGSLDELEEYTDNYQEENSIKTNKVIKEAIGRESDFDLIMSVTESTLDELVRKKEAERGRLLSRWIGLLPIEEKDTVARETFNTSIKPKLASNQYNEADLTQEISAFEVKTKECLDENKGLVKENKALEKEIGTLEKTKETLMSSKQSVDNTLLKIDITTLKTKIDNNVADGKRKNEEVKMLDAEITKIGEVEFSAELFDEKYKRLSTMNNEIGILGEQYKNLVKQVEQLKKSEICPTCGRKLDGVDNSKKIIEIEKEVAETEKKGKEKRHEVDALSREIEKLKSDRDLYHKKSQMMMKKSALEVNVEKLRNEYKDNIAIMKEYERNSAAIDKNNKIDIEVRNTITIISDKRQNRDINLSKISSNEANIKYYKEQIDGRKVLIKKLKEEEHLIKNWKIYLELVGKNGISKMVLRKTLPIINARLSELLCDVCDFEVEVAMTHKNDVMFYIVKDGVYSDLSSGSGFELTAAALALRAVLGEMSTIPKCSYVTYDEVWGRVSKENYENMRRLLEKISKSFDAVLLISHIDDIKEWCNTNIVVKKENNISKIVVNNSVMSENV